MFVSASSSLNHASCLDTGDIFDAHKLFEFETVIAETYGDVFGASYYAVAVVNSDECNAEGIYSFADLEGKRLVSNYIRVEPLVRYAMRVYQSL